MKIDRLRPSMSLRHAVEPVSRMVRAIGAVWIVVVALYLVSGIISPAMFQMGQVFNILQVASFLGVIALGQVVVMLTGGIDLSQAGMVTMTNIIATSVMVGMPENIALALLACIAVAISFGVLAGFLVTIVGITPLVTTLSLNSILFGSALVFTGGAPYGDVAEAFEIIGTGSVLGIPFPALVCAVLAIGLLFLTRFTIYGRWLYATGANRDAARMMGVSVGAVTISAYVISSLMAMAGGLLLTAYVGSPSLGIGNQYLFASVAAVVVGGAALTGGIGGTIATVGGAIFITELSSFTNIIRVSTGTQYVIQGVIIILSVLIYQRFSQRSR